MPLVRWPRWLTLSIATGATAAGCLFPSLDHFSSSGTGGAGGGGGGGARGTGGSTSSSGGGPACASPHSGRGPDGVLVKPTGHASHCIDSTEVTVKQYQAFYGSTDALPSLPKSPAVCASMKMTNDDFMPRDSTGGDELWLYYEMHSEPNRPIQGVDWCDAAVFCAWAGKRLCGADDGGGPFDVKKDAGTQGEWTHACEGPKGSLYGYGGYHPGTCYLEVGDAGIGGQYATDDVTKPPGCVTTWPGGEIHDVLGNVDEWEDNCTDGSPPAAGDLCYPRGGAFVNNDAFINCNFYDSGTGYMRGTKHEYLGFRCCWSP
jgi:formylglycine-generating enzyme required for sulfatase activity